VNDIVEVFPDRAAKHAGQRWFMIVKKANVVTVKGKISIESCRWCKTNTLQPCMTYKELTHCALENVKAYGVREAPIFEDVAPQSRPVLTDCGDAPVAATVSNSQVLARVKELQRVKDLNESTAASQSRSQREVPKHTEKCHGDAFCICSACFS
jgi:hypothetical protein